MTFLTVAIKNLKRKRVQSFVIVAVAALACGLIFSATTVLKSVNKSIELGMARLGADIMVVPAEYEEKGRKVLIAGDPTSFYMDSGNLARVKAVRGVRKAAPQLFVTSSVLMCCSMPTVLLVGYDPASDFTITPWEQHRYQIATEAMDEVIIGVQTLYASEGAFMMFYGKNFKIGSSLEATGVAFLDYSIFMTMDAARDMIVKSATDAVKPLSVRPDQISSILLKVDPAYDISAVAKEIEKAAPGVKALVTKDMVTSVRRDLDVALWGVMAAGVAFWITMLVLMGFVFAMTVNERERELGLLRAMGATRTHVLRLILTEASLLCGLGAVSGVLLSWSLLFAFKKLIIMSLGNIWFLWPSPFFIIAIGLGSILLMLLSGALSVLVPIVKLCIKEPYEAIHQHG